MAEICVGLIGTGFMGKCHALAWNAVAPTFGDVPRPRLVHLADADDDLARDRAAMFGFERSSGDWRALVDDPDVTVVSVTAPNAFHAEMAIAALEAGKHVWCEKPMATSLADALRMRDAARASGRVAVLGYNYIQNATIRHMAQILSEGLIGDVNHVRVEMDEDFMADPAMPFSIRDDATSGHGALDDFAVHPLSLLAVLVGPLASVVTDQDQPVKSRPTAEGGRRAVEVSDLATSLFRLASGASGMLAVNRAAWGRKGRIAIQIYGTAGALLYDQERLNELQIYETTGDAARRGFRTILSGPRHWPYGRFCPVPGHGLGFNDLKVIECRELIARIEGEPAWLIDFEQGAMIEATVEAMAASDRSRAWVDVAVEP